MLKPRAIELRARLWAVHRRAAASSRPARRASPSRPLRPARGRAPRRSASRRSARPACGSTSSSGSPRACARWRARGRSRCRPELLALTGLAAAELAAGGRGAGLRRATRASATCAPAGAPARAPRAGASAQPERARRSRRCASIRVGAMTAPRRPAGATACGSTSGSGRRASSRPARSRRSSPSKARIRINRLLITKPHYRVRPGDVLTFPQGQHDPRRARPGARHDGAARRARRRPSTRTSPRATSRPKASAGNAVMKVTNVKVDMFNWTTAPWKTGVGTTFGSTQQLGVVTVETDAGVSGNAFLGSSRVGADHYAPGLIAFAKPLVMGRDPQDIGAIWWDLWKREPLDLDLRHRRDRHLPLGHQRQDRRPADPPAARHVQAQGAGLFQHRPSRQGRGLCRGGAAFQGQGLERAQDPPARPAEGRHRDLGGGARGGRRRDEADARFDVGLQVRGRRCGSGAPSRRSTSTGTRTRWSRRTSTATSSCTRSSTSRSCRPSTRPAATTA